MNEQGGFVVATRSGETVIWEECKECDDSYREILDWAFVDNGILRGGETIRWMFEHDTSRSVRMDIEDRLPFFIPDSNFDWESPSVRLMLAIGQGDTESIRSLSKGREFLHVESVSRKPLVCLLRKTHALEYAVEVGNENTLRLLLDLGYPVDSCDHLGNTPLALAAATGKVKFVLILLEAGAEIDSTNTAHESSLVFAVRNNEIDTVELLLNKGADPRIVDDLGQSLAHHGCRNKRMLETLKKHGVQINIRRFDGNSPLHIAAINGDEEGFIWLAQNGLSPHEKNSEGKTPCELIRIHRSVSEEQIARVCDSN